MYLFLSILHNFCLSTGQISGNMDFCNLYDTLKNEILFQFNVLIVLPQDVLSAAPGEGWKWGRNAE
jgi:hypothetical protein